MQTKSFVVVLICSLIVAFMLYYAEVPIASSANVMLVSKFVPSVTADPADPQWAQAPALTMSLSAQTVTKPRGGGSVSGVTVQSLNDGKQVYFKLTWNDDTKNDVVVRHNDFRDAAAIQFPADPGLPYYLCMGATFNRYINIWQWKADWQRQIETGHTSTTQLYADSAVDVYPFENVAAKAGGYSKENPFDLAVGAGYAAGNMLSSLRHESPVEELLVGGVGSVTTRPVQNVAGKGVYDAQNKSWQVVLSRQIQVTEPNSINFTQAPLSAAFAVWDGAAQERDGIKSVSNWVDVQLEKGAGAGQQP